MTDYLAGVLAYLATLDGPLLAGAFLGVIALLLFLPGLVVRLGGTEPQESLSERHDRLDSEAASNIAAFERLGREANR